MFGHAGDGNVHIDVLKGDLEYVEWKASLPELKRAIYRCAIDLGGTITGEHGIVVPPAAGRAPEIMHDGGQCR